MEIKNVKIGDKFEQRGKEKSICTVVDIYTITNSNGDVVGHTCIAEKSFLGQALRFEVPFATVAINKIK